MDKYRIKDRCTGCGACISRCVIHCIDNTATPYRIDESLCNGCGKCFDNCPLMAVERIEQSLED